MYDVLKSTEKRTRKKRDFEKRKLKFALKATHAHCATARRAGQEGRSSAQMVAREAQNSEQQALQGAGEEEQTRNGR